MPAAELAWMLLQYEQQAAEAAGSCGAGTKRAGGASPANQQQQLLPMAGVPGAVLEFLSQFGTAVYKGLPCSLGSLADQLCRSDKVIQLLLAHAALCVGGAHKRVAAAAAPRAKSSSKHSQRSSSLVPAAADVPASHLRLLAALSPPLHQQLSRRYADNPRAGDYGSFKVESVS
ncbi:hypothetical protein COO60DRAFT_1120852 [Scenedesmus sp. NREL 46B-D3]|nr:hypothetical protein COO60DRAFT_1120852 [Scenedesmus sp. NREL 46B-D3]